METEYRRNLGQSYMVIKEEKLVDRYDLAMLRENHVEGLLDLEVAVAEGKQQYWYQISGKQALDVWYGEHRPGKRELKQFLLGVSAVIRNMESYLLLESALDLSVSNIYIQPGEGKFYFCYCPFQKTDFQKSIQEFMEYFLQKMDHENKEDVQLCYMIYENSIRENITIGQLLKCFQMEEQDQLECGSMGSESEENDLDLALGMHAEEKGERKELFPIGAKKSLKQKKRDPVKERFFAGIGERVRGCIPGTGKGSNSKEDIPGKERIKRENKNRENKEREYTKRENIKKDMYVATPEDDEIIEEEIHPTILLGSDQSTVSGRLLYKGNEGEENFMIDEVPFYIGTYAKEVKGVLKTSTVSRVHSKITMEEGNYYIEDMNSTNGTFVNGEILSYRERRRLEKNDEVAFADARYSFV